MFGREEDLFLNSTTASVEMAERVDRNVLHALIHQWMSYLVTPGGMEDLWLFEAMVTYIEDAHLHEVRKKRSSRK